MNERPFRFWLGLTTFSAAAAILLASWALYGRFEQTNANRAQVRENQLAVVELCGLGTTLRDVVIGGIAVVHAELQDPDVPEATHIADRMFLARFRKDLRTVDFLLNDPNSACHRAAP